MCAECCPVVSRAATWPWAEHGVTTPPKRAAPAAKKRSRGKQAVAEPEAAGDDSAAASGAEFEGKQKKRRIRAPRAKAAPRASEVVKRQVAGAMPIASDSPSCPGCQKGWACLTETAANGKPTAS